MAEIALDPRQPNIFVAMFLTGDGKSHLICIISVVEHGVVLPLLADVLAKFVEGSQRFGDVTMLHLDELCDTYLGKYDNAMLRIREACAEMTLMIFIFLSPQFLVQHKDALQIILHAICNQLLCIIVLDKDHLDV